MIALPKTDNGILDTVIHGDCLAILKTLPDNSVDSIVTDPPAGIEFMGKDWDSFKQGNLKTYKSQPGGKIGSNPGEGADFSARMGALPPVANQRANTKCINCNGFKWGHEPGHPKGGFKCVCDNPQFPIDHSTRETFIAFMREVMHEALRVLKPGGHALVWALPRTSHWTATALEDAGFEIREKCYHIFGSGFPKSLSLDKAIDKHLGKEREVIGKGHSGKTALGDATNKLNGYRDKTYLDGNFDITKPATPEAKQWQGWGSALKPSVEEWILVRKPLAASSIAANVLEYGVGGLAIDACRVGTDTIVSHGQASLSLSKRNKEQGARPYVQGIPGQDYPPSEHQGRFPSHLLLSHSIWCVPQGVKRVRGNKGFQGYEGEHIPSVFSDGGLKHRSATNPADSEGMETVEAYLCADDCPIAELDRQSGVRKSGGDVKVSSGHGFSATKYAGAIGKGEWTTNTGVRDFGDTGGCSRYFQHFPPDDYTPYLYTSKASRRERNAGCEGLPLGVSGAYGEFAGDGRGRQTEHTPAQNSHPTVKPLALMRWLIRLITPPNGVVLDMFGGSGSTAVAAIQEQKHFILVEQSSEYVAICEARIAHAWQEVGVTAQEYDCAEDCPIRIIGEQSGVSVSSGGGGYHAAGYDTRNGIYGKYGERNLPKNVGKGDTGTAARYFQQFPPDSLFADCEVDA